VLNSPALCKSLMAMCEAAQAQRLVATASMGMADNECGVRSASSTPTLPAAIDAGVACGEAIGAEADESERGDSARPVGPGTMVVGHPSRRGGVAGRSGRVVGGSAAVVRGGKPRAPMAGGHARQGGRSGGPAPPAAKDTPAYDASFPSLPLAPVTTTVQTTDGISPGDRPETPAAAPAVSGDAPVAAAAALGSSAASCSAACESDASAVAPSSAAASIKDECSCHSDAGAAASPTLRAAPALPKVNAWAAAPGKLIKLAAAAAEPAVAPASGKKQRDRRAAATASNSSSSVPTVSGVPDSAAPADPLKADAATTAAAAHLSLRVEAPAWRPVAGTSAMVH
jgi:hypothetical protein